MRGQSVSAARAGVAGGERGLQHIGAAITHLNARNPTAAKLDAEIARCAQAERTRHREDLTIAAWHRAPKNTQSC